MTNLRFAVCGNEYSSRFNCKVDGEINRVEILNASTLRGGGIGVSWIKDSTLGSIAELNKLIHHFATEENSCGFVKEWVLNVVVPINMYPRAFGPNLIEIGVVDG